ncbi:MAG: transglycosylase SLT domain-containing protein [Bdellovibrionota bacterium]|jgi:hypothetical protein
MSNIAYAYNDDETVNEEYRNHAKELKLMYGFNDGSPSIISAFCGLLKGALLLVMVLAIFSIAILIIYLSQHQEQIPAFRAKVTSIISTYSGLSFGEIEEMRQNVSSSLEKTIPQIKDLALSETSRSAVSASEADLALLNSKVDMSEPIVRALYNSGVTEPAKLINAGIVIKESRSQKVDPLLALAIAMRDSKLDASSKSLRGFGLFKISSSKIPNLTKSLNMATLTEEALLIPEINAKIGVKYIALLGEKFRNAQESIIYGYYLGAKPYLATLLGKETLSEDAINYAHTVSGNYLSLSKRVRPN